MSEQEQVVLTPEQEVAQMQERLAAAKAKQSEAESLRLGALKAKVAAINAAREQKEANERAEIDRIQQIHIERRKKEREVEAAKQREEARAAAELQQQIAAQEEVINKQREHEAKLAKIASEITAAEAIAQTSILAAKNDLEFVESGIATQTVQPDATEDPTGSRNPLHRFHQHVDIYAQDAPAATQDGSEISSEMQSRTQQKIDALINAAETGVYPTYAQAPAQTPAPVVAAEPARKTQRYVDTTTARALEDLLWSELKLRGNPNTIDNLAATFNEAALMFAARKAVAQFKATPMGWDSLMFTIEQYADAPTTVVAQGTAQPGAVCGGGM
jgi:hypothetical protein